MNKVILPAFTLFFASLVFGPAFAQEGMEEVEMVEEVKDGFENKIITPESIAADLKKDIDLSELSSLFFTFWEHNAIRDARNARGYARAPTEDELNLPVDDQKEERLKPPPEERELTLGGIVYTAQDDWTIWLNGKRVTPNALPREVLDLRVYNEYIEIKWLDEYTQRIYPVRLRAHQRFNMDTRIFLPG